MTMKTKSAQFKKKPFRFVSSLLFGRLYRFRYATKMDNLIDWQLSKKRKAEEVAKLAAEAQQKVRIPAKEETIQLNRLFGLPEQVTQVFALGKDGEAAVWWSYDPDCLKGVTGWEIWRYRLDNHQWQNKGYVRIDKLEQLQYIVKDLCNDSEYRFSVKALNIKGLLFAITIFTHSDSTIIIHRC